MLRLAVSGRKRGARKGAGRNLSDDVVPAANFDRPAWFGDIHNRRGYHGYVAFAVMNR
jgi:hypothetical protein